MALGLLFLAVACGGDGADPDPTPTNQPESSVTPVETVAGARADASATAESALNADGTYTVAEGDTLWDIANRFATTTDAIVEANGLSDADSLTVGQIIQLPAASTPAATATAGQ